MSNFPGVTEAELKADVVPAVIEYLENHGQTFTGDSDTVGHRVYAHYASLTDAARYPATVVYEGDVWADEIVEALNGAVEVGERVYEIEAYSSYEITVTLLDDYRA